MGKFLVRWGKEDGTETMRDILHEGDIKKANRAALKTLQELMAANPKVTQILSIQRLDI